MCLQTSKQHNPGAAIYLWSIIPERLQTNVLSNVCKAFCNIRLRNQHEVRLGKEWLERAEEAHAADENEVAIDKIRRDNFFKGLDRLNQACMQLDETLMSLTSFDWENVWAEVLREQRKEKKEGEASAAIVLKQTFNGTARKKRLLLLLYYVPEPQQTKDYTILYQ